MKTKNNVTMFFGRAAAYLKALLDRRTPVISKIIGIIIVLYIVMPFDFVTDFAPVLGWLDDTAVAAIGFFIIAKLIPKHVLEEYLEI